ncbi:MAG: TolC family protein [Candidatus Omnitrophica bacterium]|nr:TolC family protein [Candidatus Omnitrophota bacterium]
MRKIFLLLTIALLLTIPIKYGYTDEEPVTLASLIVEALSNSPALQAAYNNWKAAEHRVKYVSGLPDPRASYTHFGENVETRVGPQERKYGVSQKIPFPGKLHLKAKSQAKHAEMVKAKYEAAKREIIKDVYFVYYDIFWVDKAITVTEEEKAILESLEKTAQRKYESTFASQQDVIKAQVELLKLIDKLFQLRQNRRSLVSKLNSILDRPKGTGLGQVENVKPVKFGYQLEELHKMAQESRQELVAANLDMERARYEKSLAGLDYLPDFTLGFDYVQVGEGYTSSTDDGQDAWTGTVAVNVPIWFDKLGAQLKEKKAALEASKKDYQNIENSVAYEIEDLYFKITTYKDIVSLYETALIPQTEQAFESARTSYETGSVDFLNWLDSERVLLQTRLAYYKIVTDYLKSIAYMERVVGRDL